MSSYEDFLSEPIFYNSSIKINGKSFIKGTWFQKGISQICDLVDERGNFFTLNAFNTLYELNISFLEYYGVINSINAYLRKQT